MSPLIVLEKPGLYGFKPQFQRLLRPAVRELAARGVRANQVTVAACVLSVSFGALLLTSSDPRLFAFLPAVLLARMALNAADGMLARQFSQRTSLGVYLNELCDVASDSFLYLPLAHLYGFSPFWIWNVVVLSVISETAGIIAAMAGAGRRYDGPMGKSDRALIFGATGLWAGLCGGVPVWFASILPKIVCALLALTIVNRVRKGVEEAEGKEGEHAAM